MMKEGGYFDSTDIAQFLENLSEKILGRKWGIFWDNVSIHKSEVTK